MAINDELDFEIDEDKRKQFIEDTTLRPQIQSVEYSLEHGTIKITPELAKQAVQAIDSRVKACEGYTRQRVDRINKNYAIYNGENVDNNNAITKANYSSTFNVVEDWVDDLVTTFIRLPESIRLTCYGNSIDTYIAQTLLEDERDNDSSKALFLSLARAVLANKDSQGNPETEGLRNIAEGATKKTSTYFFSVKESIKEMLAQSLKDSGFEANLEELMYNGVISGMFCVKEGWDNNEKYALEVSEDTDDKQYLKTGKVSFTAKKQKTCQFVPKDPRNLIFRKDKIDWMIEKFDSTFHELLNDAFDTDGKPKQYPTYDPVMLNKIKECIMDENAKLRDDVIENEDSYDPDVVNYEDIYMIDGDIKGYNAHHIPLVIDKKVVKCLVVSVTVNDKTIPIRIQKTPFIDLPYKFTYFLSKKGNTAGIGLPELVEELQAIICSFYDFSVDMMNTALGGYFVGDASHFEDPSQVKDIKPREMIRLKNMKGMRIDDVFKQYLPPLEALSYMNNLFTLTINMLEKTSRKGPGGEKVAPNPSATEFASMTAEMQKSVNRCGIRINRMLVDVVRNQYLYQMLNRDSYFNLKMKSFKLLPGGSVKQVDKEAKLEKRQLLVEGIDFEVDALEFSDNQMAVEKQQLMQLVDVLYNKIGVMAPSTEMMPDGTAQQVMKPKIFNDDTGAEVVLDEFKLVRKILGNFGYDDLFKQKEDAEEVEAMPPAGVAGGVTGPSVSSPDMGQLNPTDMGNILASTNNAG